MTAQEQEFLEQYFICWNATEAARRAGYKWPGRIGWQKKEKFQQEIKDRLKQSHMDAEEVLSRLANQARGNIAEFIDIENSDDVKELNGKAAIIQKFKKTRNLRNGTETIEIELYNAQSALEKIGKYHGLFKEEAKIDGSLEIKVVYTDDNSA